MLYEDYKKSPTSQKAEDLLKSLNTGRKEKWNSVLSNMNFTHSSRSSWDVLRKLGEAAPIVESTSKINPELIARRLEGVSNSVKISRSEVKEMRKNLHRLRSSLSVVDVISRPFSLEELTSAIKCVTIQHNYI